MNNKYNSLLYIDPLELADKVRFEDSKQIVFNGIVISRGEQQKGEVSYIASDWAWYLETSDVSYYFEETPYDVALKTILENLGFGLIKSVVGEANVNITKFFKNEKASNIISYILNEVFDKTRKNLDVFPISNKDFVLDYTDRQKYIDGNMNVIKTHNVEVFGQDVNLVDLTIAKNHNTSFEDMKNKIIVVSGADDSVTVDAVVLDQALIDKYGQLTLILDKEAENDLDAITIAHNNLRKYKAIHEDISLNIAKSTVAVQVGDIIKIEDDELAINGVFEIATMDQIFSEGLLSTTINLERIT